MSDVTIITTFTKKGYEEYAHRMLSSFLEFISPDINFIVYVEDFIPDIRDPRVEYRDLNKASPQLISFKQKFSQFELARGIIRTENNKLTYDYNKDAVKFCHKVFCVTHGLLNSPTRYMFWLDADTVAKKPISSGFLLSFFSNSEYMCYLGRKHMHTETGFVGYDTHHPAHIKFVKSYESIYNSGEIFKLDAWHDCLALDVVRELFEKEGLITTNNISKDVDTATHPFVNTVLGEYMDHLKGFQRKKVGHSFQEDIIEKPMLIASSEKPKTVKRTERQVKTVKNIEYPVGISSGRYTQIIDLIREVKPSSIVEIGTWNGFRAMEMAKEALKYNRCVMYYGFDLFEFATDETDKEEKNVKPHYTMENVSRFLREFKNNNPGFNYRLIAGNTRETLSEMAVDFAFIDGGHSVETIQSDYVKLRKSKVVLFDDYYEGGIDTELYGCNKIVESLDHKVLPIADPVSGGGQTKLVVVGL